MRVREQSAAHELMSSNEFAANRSDSSADLAQKDAGAVAVFAEQEEIAVRQGLTDKPKAARPALSQHRA